jgi:tetratricopeptide (TPR) repeat protein
MPPFLLAMGFWIDYDRRGKWGDYFLALGLFLVAMLCKTSMMMFPFVILLYAWWKRGSIRWRDLKNSAAFFAVSLAVGLALISFVRHGVGEELIPLGGFFSRMACAGLSISFYFSKCFLPVDLLPMYPQWNINPPSLAQFLPWPVLGGAICWLWIRRRPWGRHVLFGFGFFLINLAPFVGFHTISFMRFAWVMDHFLYLPIIGLLGLVVAALEQLDERLGAPVRPYGIGGIALVTLLLAFGSHRYAKIYINSLTQWTYTIQRNPDAWPAHNDLGNALSDAGRMSEAKEQYEEALRLNPDYPEAHNNLGIIFAQTGRLSDAIDQFEQALRLCPELDSARGNLEKVQAWQKNRPIPK